MFWDNSFKDAKLDGFSPGTLVFSPTVQLETTGHPYGTIGYKAGKMMGGWTQLDYRIDPNKFGALIIGHIWSKCIHTLKSMCVTSSKRAGVDWAACSPGLSAVQACLELKIHVSYELRQRMLSN